MIHVLGGIGMVLILGAYFLVSTKRLDGGSTVYQTMNLVGSIALIVYSAVLGAWASVALNVAWALIAAAALVRARL